MKNMKYKLIKENIKQEELVGLVDDFYLEAGKEYTLIEVCPRELNLINRLDIFIKLDAIQYIINETEEILPIKVYFDHLVAMTGGTCKERGNANKSKLSDFYKSFQETIKSISDKEFSEKESIIPLNDKNEPLNGAHRIASALYYNKKVKCIICGERSVDYGFEFFKSNSFDKYILFKYVGIMQEYQSDLLTGIVWPSVNIDIKDILPNVLLSHNLELSLDGLKNVVINTYSNEPWLGNPGNGFDGAINKATPCSGNNPLQVFIYKTSQNEDVVEIKNNIRNKFNLGKNSIHICDNTYDSVPLTLFTLNPSSCKILNSIKFYRYPKFIEEVIKISSENSGREFILSGSSLLGLLGLRHPNDIDYLAPVEIDSIYMDYHGINNGAQSFYTIDSDPYNSFYFFGVKFYSIKTFIKFKRLRAESKDIADIRLLKGFFSGDMGHFNSIYLKTRMKMTVTEIKIKNKSKKMLRKFGIFDLARKIYLKFRVK